MSERMTAEREAEIRDAFRRQAITYEMAEDLMRELDAVRAESADRLQYAQNNYDLYLAAAAERDEAHRRVMDFTGAPTVDEAFAVIESPVEWDAIASYHGVALTPEAS